MAVSCRDIITRALRKTRVYAPGEIPNADEMADGLDELQSLYEQWGSAGMFGRLEDVLTDQDYSAAPNERITVKGSAIITIPTSFNIAGEEVPPFEMGFIEVIDTVLLTVTRYIYSGGAWVSIGGLTLDSSAPLAGRGRAGLSACLALSLAEEFGAQVGAGVARQAMSFKMGLAMKYGADALRSTPAYF